MMEERNEENVETKRQRDKETERKRRRKGESGQERERESANVYMLDGLCKVKKNTMVFILYSTRQINTFQIQCWDIRDIKVFSIIVELVADFFHLAWVSPYIVEL